MSIHNYCLPHLDTMLQYLVNTNCMSLDVAHRVADLFKESAQDFDYQITQRFGNRVDHDLAMSCMERALKGIANSLVYGGSQFGSVVQSQPFNQMAFGSTVPNTIFGNRGYMQQQQGPGLINSISAQAGSIVSPGSNMKLDGLFGIKQPTAVPVEEKKVQANNSTAIPQGVTSLSIYTKHDEGLDMNGKIALAAEGSTKEAVDDKVINLMRKVVKSTGPDGDSSYIKLDHVIFTQDLGEICFDGPREVIEFLDAILTVEDVKSPYFRIVDYTQITAIDIPHDDFMAEANALSEELHLIEEMPYDLFTGRDMFRTIKTKIADRSRIFREKVEDFLLDLAASRFAKYFRSSNNVKMELKLTSLDALEALVTSSDKSMKALRSIQGFEGVITQIFKDIYEFCTFQNPISPLPISMEFPHKKHPSLDPYIQTRKYMSVDNKKRINSMEYWKFFDDPTTQEEILKLIKSKTLVRKPESFVVTNVYSPLLLRSSLFTGSPKPVLVSATSPLSVQEQNFQAGGEIISLINYLKVKKDRQPGQIFIKLGDDFKALNLSSTLEGDFLLTV